MGSLSLPQGIFPTQESNPGLPHCRWILYQLSCKGRPKILDWVVYPFYSGSSWPRNWTRVSCTAGGFFTNWAIRETKILTLIVCFLLLLKREIKNVWYLQPISSIWRPLAFLPVTLSFSPFLLGELCCLEKGASFSFHNCFWADKGCCP